MSESKPPSEDVITQRKARTLVDYRPQHDVGCQSEVCQVCRVERSGHDFAVRTEYAVAHEWTPRPCTCGLDALIAAVSSELKEKDHGAGLAAVGNDTTVAETETASVYVMPEHRGFAGVCGGLSCKAVLLRLGGEMETVIEFRYPPPLDYREPIRVPMSLAQPDESTFARIRCRTFKRDDRLRSPDHKWWLVYNSGRTRSPFDAYVYREIAEPLAGNQAATSGIASPAASSALNASSQIATVSSQKEETLMRALNQPQLRAGESDLRDDQRGDSCECTWEHKIDGQCSCGYIPDAPREQGEQPPHRCEESLGMAGTVYRCALPSGHAGLHVHDPTITWRT